MATLTTAEPGQSGTSAWTKGESGAAHPGVLVADRPPADLTASQRPRSVATTPPASAEQWQSLIGVRARRIWMDDDTVDRITGVDLVLSGVDIDDELRISGYLGGESYLLKPDSEFARMASDPVAGMIGVELRYEPWAKAMIGPVLGGGIAGGYLLWSYEDDPTSSGSNRDGLDLLYIFQCSASAGLRLGRANGPHVLLEVMPVLRFYDLTTERNYEQEWLGIHGGLGLSCTLNATW